jgi:hypothetical protein
MREMQRLAEQFNQKLQQKTFMQTYIIQHPDSKLLAVWNFVWLVVMLSECTLVPYTACLDFEVILAKTQSIEIAIDLLWLVHMFVTLTTSFYVDIELITDVKQIAMKYAKELMWLDVITTFPTLFTWYTIKNLYYIKILRCFYILKATSILKRYILTLESIFSLSKQTVYKIDYFVSILIIVSFMMHSVSCAWLLIGMSYEYTWITHP